SGWHLPSFGGRHSQALPASQPVTGFSQVVGGSTGTAGPPICWTQTPPSEQRQPTDTPPSPLLGSGTHLHVDGSQCDPRMHRTVCTHWEGHMMKTHPHIPLVRRYAGPASVLPSGHR